MTLPGHNYLGPGNTIDPIGHPPTSELDAIAMKHDMAYRDAMEQADIERADREFERNAWRQGITGKAAASAIKLKRYTEKLYGGNLYGLSGDV